MESDVACPPPWPWHSLPSGLQSRAGGVCPCTSQSQLLAAKASKGALQIGKNSRTKFDTSIFPKYPNPHKYIGRSGVISPTGEPSHLLPCPTFDPIDLKRSLASNCEARLTGKASIFDASPFSYVYDVEQLEVEHVIKEPVRAHHDNVPRQGLQPEGLRTAASKGQVGRLMYFQVASHSILCPKCSATATPPGCGCRPQPWPCARMGGGEYASGPQPPADNHSA